MTSLSPLTSRAAVLCAALACGLASLSAEAGTGSYLRLFGDTSLWNSRPVSPVLGTYEIPASQYFPTIAEGGYSTGLFKALASNPAVTVVGLAGTAGVWDPDAEAYRTGVTIPRWPADVKPAAGSDGHADIVDEAAGVVHSFWQLRNDYGTWRAAQYAWTPLNGRGWGEGGHYYQGARATGVPAAAGLIRKHEVNDGDTQYRHALAMSLTFNGLAGTPSYVFPATTADGNAATANTGQVPEGTLLMLPPTFDVSRLTSPALRKVAQTLKTHGGFVVDRNVGTPFVIYVENGSGFKLMPNGWSNTVAAELDLIRKSLRTVLSTAGWLDANGTAFSPTNKLNVMSMRGSWGRLSGNGSAAFDTLRQAVVLPAASVAGEYRNVGNRNVVPPNWAKPVAGQTFKFSVNASGGARLKLDIVDKATSKVAYSTGYVAHGGTQSFTWPSSNYVTVLYVASAAGQEAVVSGRLAQP